MTHVVDDDGRWQLAKEILEIGQLGRLEIDDHVPAERRDATGEHGEDIRRCHVDQAPDEVEARAADAGGIELGELCIGRGRSDRRDAAGTIAGGAQRIDDSAVVGAVTGRLHEHIALEAEVIAQRPELLLRRIARCVLALGCEREALAGTEHVTVRINAAGWQPETRPRRLRVKGQPAGVHRERAGGAVRCPARTARHDR